MIMPLTPTPLLSVPLPGELWPVGPLRTQHFNFLEREMELFSEVQNTMLYCLFVVTAPASAGLNTVMHRKPPPHP